MSYREFGETVRTLIGFAPVRALFVFHVERWRRKRKVIAEHICQIDQLIAPLCEMPLPFHFSDWTLHGVGDGRRCKVPPEFEARYERLKNRPLLFPRDDDQRIRDRTPSELFAALAAVHDSLSGRMDFRLGPSELGESPSGERDYVFEVWRLSELGDQTGLLRNALIFVLTQIEKRIVPTTLNASGELLIDVIVRIRKQWDIQSAKSLAIQEHIAREFRPVSVEATPAAADERPDDASNYLPTSALANDALTVLAKLAGSELQKLLAIIQDSTLSGEQKMDAMLRADNGLKRLDSPQWAELLGVSANAIRQYSVWKALRRKERAPDEQ